LDFCIFCFFQGAEELFKRAIEADPELAHVLCSYGLLRLNLYNDPDGAEGLFRRALAVDPAHVATLYNYGSLLEGARQNFSGAEEMYKRVLAVEPLHMSTLSNYGGLLHTVSSQPNIPSLTWPSCCQLPLARTTAC
jgi:tetratricopeptide (TPR) repeat protein